MRTKACIHCFYKLRSLLEAREKPKTLHVPREERIQNRFQLSKQHCEQANKTPTSHLYPLSQCQPKTPTSHARSQSRGTSLLHVKAEESVQSSEKLPDPHGPTMPLNRGPSNRWRIWREKQILVDVAEEEELTKLLLEHRKNSSSL